MFWNYYSESRNILAWCSVHIKNSNTCKQARQQVDAALAEVLRRIDESYARRL